MSKISEEIIHAGDRLILATGKNFQNLDNITENFYTISNIKQNVKFGNEKSFIVLISFMMVIGLSAIGIVSLMKALLVFLFGLLIFKAIDPKEIIKRFRYDVFIIVGSSLAIEKVFEDNGITKDLALFIINNFGCYGVYTTFIAIFIFNVVLTQFMAKNAVAALTFPIAYATALGLGVNPIPFIFAVIYWTSASFIIPYGYATNLMVSSLGNYKIQDFIKIGLIVTLIYSLVVIIFVPIFFPF